jgi:protein gp37
MVKRDFWDFSFNPVWGCENKCEYCYARRIAKRYYKQIALKEIKYITKKMFYLSETEWAKGEMNCGLPLNYTINSLENKLKTFTPTWLESNYVRKFPKKPSIIFVNSMSDPAYWKQFWYEKILKRITKNFQHTFVILTKDVNIYKKYTFPHNTILGVTCTTQKTIDQLEVDISNWFDPNNKVLISIEPIQEEIKIPLFLQTMIDWIHVGQESGNRKNRIKATADMVRPFYNLSIPVFMKENIRGICYPNLRKEFPI